MKRPLAVSAVALIIGILIADNAPSMGSGLFVVFLFCIAASFVYRKLATRSPFILLALPLMISGFVLHYRNIQSVNTRFLPWQESKVLVRGSICNEPVFSDGRIIFTLAVDSIIHQEKTTPVRNGKIKVSVYSDSSMDELRYGRNISIVTNVEIPAEQRNIGGFDYRRFLAAKGISGVCSINPSQISVLEGDRSFFLKSAGYAVRQSILDALYGSIPEQEASVVAGMLIGYTQEMPESMEESFRRAGMSHIMAVSGANLAFLLLPFIWLLKRIGLNPRWASVISLPVMIIYIFATGMEASVIRAGIMAGIMLLGTILWRQTDFFCSISASALLILLFNTFMLFDTGFILSYSASLSLVIFYKPVFQRLPAKLPKLIRDTLAGTFSAQLGVLPVIACTFNSFSVVSILTNLIVVPITGILTGLAAVIAILWVVFQPVCSLLGLGASFLTNVILMVTRTVSSVPWAELAVATPGVLLVAGYYLILLTIRYGLPRLERGCGKPVGSCMGAGLMVNGGDEKKGFAFASGAVEDHGLEKDRESCTKNHEASDMVIGREIEKSIGAVGKKRGRRLIACMLAFYGCLILMGMIPSGKLEIYFADVGQGDCIIIKTPSGRSIMIDGGGSIYDDEESSYTGEMIVIPALYDLKITRIDVMIASHGHADHINGLKSVMDKMGVKRLVVADAEDSEMNELTDYAHGKGISVERVDQDDIIYSEKDLVITAVYPFDDKGCMPTSKTTSANELSLVTRLDYAGFSAMFTGDIGFSTENLLLGRHTLDCDLLKVPHHGSKYSSGAEFVRQVSPAVAVICVGKNRYGHPNEDVKKRYTSAGAHIYETLRHGGIRVRIDSRKPDQISLWTVIKE